MSRFDYVKYDETSKRDQEEAKKAVELVERTIEMICPLNGRAKATALTKLEECYMWIGKMIRDDQLSQAERLAKTQLQEERNNS